MCVKVFWVTKQELFTAVKTRHGLLLIPGLFYNFHGKDGKKIFCQVFAKYKLTLLFN